MYCPNCASENNDTVRYCRSCGANLSLVPQALTGRLPEEGRRRRRDFERGGDAVFARGVIKLFSGLAFLMVSIALSFSAAGRGWWFWMLIPAFGGLGKGIAEIFVAQREKKKALDPARTVAPAARKTGELPPQPDFAHAPPPSITEDTTRRFDPVVGRPQERQ